MRRLPSPALVVACVALAVALGGAGYAATTLPRNSVGSKQVKNGSLQRIDFAKGQLPPGTEKGQVLVSVPPTAWTGLVGSALEIDHFGDAVRVTSGAAAEDVFVGTGLEIPVALYGKRVRFVGAEVCYSVAGNVELDSVNMSVFRQPSGPASTDPVSEFVDGSNQKDESACRVYKLTAPFVLTADDMVSLAIGFDFTAGASAMIGRTTAILEPTTANAAPPG